jgi:hypothetical protein
MNEFDRTIQELLNGTDDVETTQDIAEIPAMSPVVYEEKSSQLENEENPDLDEDYKFARSNLYALIGKANAALEMTLKIAQMTESVKCVDSAAQIIQVSSNLTKSLLDLQKQVKDSKSTKPSGEGSGNTYIQNNNFYTKEEEQEVNNVLDQLEDD